MAAAERSSLREVAVPFDSGDNARMDPISSLSSLRTAWQPLNDEHREGRRYSDGVHLRIYRCLSWADRAEAITNSTVDGDADLSFILRTMGFNALWGQDYRPGTARPSQLQEWTDFLVDLSKNDPQGRLRRWITASNPLLDGIYANPFFHREFWSEPGSEDLGGQERVTGRLEEWRSGNRLDRLYAEFVRRMILLRGQLIHGNASHAGNVNRTTVAPAAMAMDQLLRVVLEVLILDGAHAADLRWSPVPYPPTPEGGDSD